jgi:vacuolar protein sorting-associated protein 45
MLRYSNSGETVSSSFLTTKDVTKITEKIFKVWQFVRYRVLFLVVANQFDCLKGLKGVENVFTQHSPVLKDIMDNIVKGRLSEDAFPAAGGESTAGRLYLFEILLL